MAITLACVALMEPGIVSRFVSSRPDAPATKPAEGEEVRW